VNRAVRLSPGGTTRLSSCSVRRAVSPWTTSVPSAPFRTDTSTSVPSGTRSRGPGFSGARPTSRNASTGTPGRSSPR
jgi:hypothetical protein